MTAFRDAARRVLEARLPADDPKWESWIEGTLDELDGCVPPQGIDRDALLDIINDAFEYAGYEAGGDTLNEFADRILALVRPVEGVVLTPVEARLFAALLRSNVDMLMRNDILGSEQDYIGERRALAARLEASS